MKSTLLALLLIGHAHGAEWRPVLCEVTAYAGDCPIGCELARAFSIRGTLRWKEI